MSSRQTYLNGAPDGPGLHDFAVNGMKEQGSLGNCDEQQQHKGSQHSLVNAAAVQAQCDIRNGYKMRHHIDQASWFPAEICPSIPGSARAVLT